MFSQVSVCPQGGCIRGSGVWGCVWQGHAWQGGMPPADTMRYGQRAGGTHPTGMHSCSVCSSRLNMCNLYLLVHSQSDGDHRLGEGELKDELRVLVLLGVIPDQHWKNTEGRMNSSMNLRVLVLLGVIPDQHWKNTETEWTPVWT